MRFQPSEALFTEGVHPRIFFGPGDVAALRDKVKGGIAAAAFQRLIEQCEGFCDPSSDGYVDLTACGEGPLPARQARPLAFAYTLTGDSRWKDRALELMRRIAARGVADRHGHSSIPPDAFPVAYDMLHDEMSDEDRRRAGEFIRSEVEKFKTDFLGHPERHVWLLGTNPPLASLLFFSYWIAAAYEPQRDAETMRQYADMMRRSMHLGIDEGGAIGEGPNYGLMDAFRWVIPAEIFYRAGVADFWTEEPRMLAMLRWWAYLMLPGRREVNPIHDAVRASGFPPFPHLLGARRTGDPLLQWIWQTLGGRPPIGPESTHPYAYLHNISGNLDLIILWEEDDAEARPPGPAGCPLHYHSGDFGVNVLRGGWEDDSLYFSLLASGRTPGVQIHQHVDGGHFSLFAMKEAFSIDTGYGDIQARYHSVVMPVGKEPPTSPLDFDNSYAGGRTELFAPGRLVDYCKVDLSWQWDCFWNHRHALVVRVPGAEPYVVLLDNINYRNEWCFYDWLMQSEPGNRIELDPAAVRATVFGRENRMEVVFSYPREGEYDPSHRMELYADEIDSHPLDHVAPAKRLGIGVRPRLIARLWGANGQMLTALVPRRAGQAPVAAERLGGPMQFGLRIDHGGSIDTIIANPIDRALKLEGIAGEAAVAFVRRDRNGKVLHAAAADAFALSIDNRPVLPRSGRPCTLWEPDLQGQ